MFQNFTIYLNNIHLYYVLDFFRNTIVLGQILPFGGIMGLTPSHTHQFGTKDILISTKLRIKRHSLIYISSTYPRNYIYSITNSDVCYIVKIFERKSPVWIQALAIEFAQPYFKFRHYKGVFCRYYRQIKFCKQAR